MSMNTEGKKAHGLEHDSVAGVQAERVFGEPSLKSTDLQQVCGVFCRAADVLWVLAIAPRLMIAGKAVQQMASPPAFCDRKKTPANNPLTAVYVLWKKHGSAQMAVVQT